MGSVMKLANPDRAFGQALQGRGFGVGGKGAPKPPPPRPIRELRDDEIDIGIAEHGDPVGLHLGKTSDGRLLIQGASGAGKSWTLRRLIEQTAMLIQQIVVDPEGEFGELADALGMLRLDGSRLDAAALATAAERIREHQISAHLDLSEIDREDQQRAIAAFFTPLIAAPRKFWTPVLVAVDEAQLFAPHGGFSEATAVRKASIAAVADMMGRGRKRGLIGVLATLRLARIAKSAYSDIQNFLIGLNTLDLDIKRATEMIGWEARKGFDRLPMLTPGDFVAVGPAFSQNPVTLHVGPVKSRHIGSAPPIVAPISRTARDAAKLVDVEALMSSTEADRTMLAENAQPLSLRHVRQFIRDPAFADAGRLWGALLKLAPAGAVIVDLARHVNRSADQVASALDLLDRYGTVEFVGDGRKRAVRLAEDMTP